MCRLLSPKGAEELSASSLYGQRSDALTYVNHLVNGNFLRVRHGASVMDKVDACLSVICALSKEFNLDWIAEDVESRSDSEKKEFMSAFGTYLEVPLRTLSELLKRCRLIGRRSPRHAMQKQFDEFWAAHTLARCQDDKAEDYGAASLLLIYIATALECHKLWQHKQDVVRPIPWTLKVNKAGTRVTLRYHFWTGRPYGKSRRIVKSHADYVLPIKLSFTSADGINSLQHAVRNNGQRQDSERS